MFGVSLAAERQAVYQEGLGSLDFVSPVLELFMRTD
jgi:hypothetical protein